MRLAFATTLAGSPWGGCEELWAETARQALTAGHEVLVLTYRWPSQHASIAELQGLGARIHQRPVAHDARRSWIGNTLGDPFEELLRFAPDVVVVNQAATYDISYRGEMNALRRTLTRNALRYVLLCHCEEDAPQTPRRVQRARSAFERAIFVGFLSDRLRRVSESHLNIRFADARIFQNPLRGASPGILPWPSQDTLRMAFVGRLEAIKGLDLLIAALAGPRWRERPWMLTLYGSGSSEAALKQQIHDAALHERVQFAGFVADIGALWREQHVLVMPSRAEGVPLALHEAALCGRPAVITDVGGVAAWLIDDQTGFLAFQPTVDAVASTLERLWQARHALERMGHAAHAHLTSRRDPDPGQTLLRWLQAAGTAQGLSIASSPRVGSQNAVQPRTSANGLLPIHMFWHGQGFARMERLCAASFLAQGHEVRLHVYAEPANVPVGVKLVDANRTLPERYLFRHIGSGSIAAFADWFRYQLLYEEGGIWADTDVVCLKPLRYDQPEIFARQDEQIINNAVLGLPAGHDLAAWMIACCEHPNRVQPYDNSRTRRRKRQRRLLRGNQRGDVEWGEHGPLGFTMAARHMNYENRALPFWHFYPVHYLHWRSVFDASLRDNPNFVAGSTTLHLWNEMTRRAVGFDINAPFPADSLFEQLCARHGISI